MQYLEIDCFKQSSKPKQKNKKQKQKKTKKQKNKNKNKKVKNLIVNGTKFGYNL